MKRSKVEKKWLKECSPFKNGAPLCPFTKRLKLDSWQDIWESQDAFLINEYFEYGDDRMDLIYLTRALSLHMLLDDMGLE